MERLYSLSRSILLTDTSQAVAQQIVRAITQAFDAPAAAVYDLNSGEIYYAGPSDFAEIDGPLREAAKLGSFIQDPPRATFVTPIRLGGEPIGSLALRCGGLSDAVVQAIANLVAIGLEKARAQEAANRAQMARQSQELKSTLLDAMAHEFKTPLTSMKAATSALMSDMVDRGEERRELVSVVDEEVDHLNRLVTEAIQVARIEAGDIQLHRAPCPVGAMVAEVLKAMESSTSGRAVIVQMDQESVPVEADTMLIELALRQLADNAVRYSPPGSELQINATRKGGLIVIRVLDHGGGIPADDQAKIFERFYRGSNVRHTRGTGMGLAIAREIARAHGGDVWLEETSSRGSEFCLGLPLTSKEPEL